jgi:hypothetical protein
MLYDVPAVLDGVTVGAAASVGALYRARLKRRIRAVRNHLAERFSDDAAEPSLHLVSFAVAVISVLNSSEHPYSRVRHDVMRPAD